MSVVGWYVHHHGAGHVTRFLAVRPHVEHDVVVFSSLPEPRDLPARTTWIVLPRDDDPVPQPDGSVRSPRDADHTVRGQLHWAPVGHPGHTARLATIAARAAESRLGAFVVDVSAEVAVFVRLLGVPVIVVTQPGDRDDRAHRLAYDLADRILAPWRAGTHDSPALARQGSRVEHVGAISRFDGRDSSRDGQPTGVLVLGGTGGTGGSGPREHIAAAAAATPGTSWTIAGADADSWVADPWPLLRGAEVVVSAAGQNSVADLAAAGARAVVIPQERPFGEQAATGARLAALDLAIVEPAWPDPARWPEILRRARALAPDWASWGVAGAAGRAADVIHEVVEQNR